MSESPAGPIRSKNPIKVGILCGAVAVALMLVFGDLWMTTSEVGFTPRSAQHGAAVFVLCMALWLTNAIPVAATGLLAVGLLATLEVLPKQRAFALFGNSALFFMLGVFILAAAMITTGLSKRLTLHFLHRFDQTPRRLIQGVLLSSAAIALVMPEHAVAAMMFPILLEIAEALKLEKKKSQYAKMMFLALAWGAMAGGTGTILGGARAPLAIGLLLEFNGTQISFVSWMAASLPIAAVMVLVAWLVIGRSFTIDVESIQAATRMLGGRVRRIGPMSSAERRMAVLGVLTVVSWVFWGHSVGLAVISLLAASGVFILGIASWHELQDLVNWGVLIMYGGAVALGTALSETHAASWLLDRIVSPEIQPNIILAGMAVLAILLTECVSNSAAVAILLPVGFSLCETIDSLSPTTMTLAVAVPAGLAFSLPISSPPNAICFSAGHYSVKEVLPRGAVLSVAALILVLGAIFVYWPMLRWAGLLN